MPVQLATVAVMEKTYVTNWALDLQIDEERSFGDAGPDLWSAIENYFVKEMYRPN
ncbi:MAG: hypothetical protein M3160_06465 [Candidatus Eremiobacteraeota bacterium]|nr:hypothetical protein [Candidatus Eremiobacteraeota bacterium]